MADSTVRLGLFGEGPVRPSSGDREAGSRNRLAAGISCLFLACIGSDSAQAACAEDLTRIQVRMAQAAPDVQSRLTGLIADAQAKAKAQDAAGCNSLTAQALQLLGLPVLPPLQLSTPVVGTTDVAHANQPSEPAASPVRASPDPRSEAARKATPTQPQESGSSQAMPPGGGGTAAQRRSVASTRGDQQTGQPQQSATGEQATQIAAPVAGSGQTRAAGGSAAFATDQPTGAAQEQPFFISARDLIGTQVVDEANHGHVLGRVASIIIDQATGRAVYVTLEWGGFLGWDKNRILVPFEVLSFSGRWDRPWLRVPASKVENAPQFREGDLDQLLRDPDWRRAITQYFGTAVAGNEPGAGGEGRVPQRSVEPAGPRPTTQGTPAAAAGQGSSVAAASSNPMGAVSDPKAQPGEGATGPTAGSGNAAASVTTTVAGSPGGANHGADPQHGQALVQRSCAACHTLNQGGATRVGPNLFGVAERPVASVPGYNYSNALKSHTGEWDAVSLDAFLRSPRGYAPGTYMTFAGISSDRDRRDVVAYLESLKPEASK